MTYGHIGFLGYWRSRDVEKPYRWAWTVVQNDERYDTHDTLNDEKRTRTHDHTNDWLVLPPLQCHPFRNKLAGMGFFEFIYSNLPFYIFCVSYLLEHHWSWLVSWD